MCREKPALKEIWRSSRSSNLNSSSVTWLSAHNHSRQQSTQGSQLLPEAMLARLKYLRQSQQGDQLDKRCGPTGDADLQPQTNKQSLDDSEGTFRCFSICHENLIASWLNCGADVSHNVQYLPCPMRIVSIKDFHFNMKEAEQNIPPDHISLPRYQIVAKTS